ncbi:MAG TPA: XRE family transcriptional regulator, partial [Clostridia bacterium]
GGDLTSIEMIVDEIDWTSAWSKKYPILASYQGMKGISFYSEKISELYDTFKNEFGFNDQDTVLVLKDILYQKYKSAKKKSK